MKKFLAIVAFAALLVIPTRQAAAKIGAIDAVPAATLLLPYFEVDLANPDGVTTLFSINNASATAVLAHVTLWSDLGVPTFGFNVYLTGYDVQTINLRDIFNGTVPRTASDGQDPTDTISPQGPFSQDINFASCTGLLPPPPIPTTPFDYIAHLRDTHRGLASAVFVGKCSGVAYGDNIARGYVTVDTLNRCTTLSPADPGYFYQGPDPPGPDLPEGPDVTFQNVLWGDYFYVNSSQNFAQGDSLVHIEADITNPETSNPGQYTFYGRYTSPIWNAQDHREPLATSFALRFLNGGAFTGGTHMIAWRDPKTNQAPFACPAANGNPPWFPLGQEGVAIFDEQEQWVAPVFSPFFPPPPTQYYVPFGASATSTKPGDVSFPVPFTFGWIYFNLNTTIAGNPNPPEDPGAAQAWVTVTHDADGRYSVGYSAIALDSATAANHLFPPFP